MSRITSRIAVVVAGAAAGFVLSALGSAATANADTAIPVNPGLGGLFEQVVASSASIPAQLLQTASSLGSSSLGGSGLAPAAAPGQAPLATATLNMPQNLTPTGAQAPQSAAPASGLSGLTALPGDLGAMLPFPMPNLAGTAAAPAAAVGAAPMVSAPIVSAIPSPVLIPGLP